MANRNLFGSTPIQVPNRSGFDLSHENMLTLKCGQLVPVMTDLLIPGDRVSVGSAFEIQLPPMATDFYGRVRFKMEAFFVPCRLLYGGWQKFMTSPTGNNAPSASTVSSLLPFCFVPAENAKEVNTISEFCGSTISKRRRAVNTLERKNSNAQGSSSRGNWHSLIKDRLLDTRITIPIVINLVISHKAHNVINTLTCVDLFSVRHQQHHPYYLSDKLSDYR